MTTIRTITRRPGLRAALAAAATLAAAWAATAAPFPKGW
jgi:hypothetical protein